MGRGAGRRPGTGVGADEKMEQREFGKNTKNLTKSAAALAPMGQHCYNIKEELGREERCAMDRKGKMKQIRDSIHGYIEVPEVVFHQLIDTEIFQRLRQIEQTSMRSLYPSAHHDRFIHSLGVYHLGQLACQGLTGNLSGMSLYQKHGEFWERYGLSFQLACLLHDCAHAPMSHSFEHGYLNPADPADVEAKQKRLADSMVQGLDQKNEKGRAAAVQAEEDVKKYFSEPDKIAPHEMASAILTGEYFRDRVRRVLEELWGMEDGTLAEHELALHIQFMQRAIIGLPYSQEPDLETSFQNCLISLLNGSFFDVDKLDYIVRDSVQSGANNMSIDIPRILRALTLVEVNFFMENTKVENLMLNNAVEFSCFQSEMKDISEDVRCEIALEVKNAYLNGKIQGEMEFKENVELQTPSGRGRRTDGSEKFVDMVNVNAEVYGESTVRGWFTGSVKQLNSFNPVKIDGIIHSLISSATIKGKIIGHIDTEAEHKVSYEIGYNKSALSVIEDTLIARNRLYLWIYAHHKVTYNDYLLRSGVLYALLTEKEKALDPLEKKKAGLERLRERMDLDKMFLNPTDPDSYLLSDGDMIALMKRSAVQGVVENPFAKNWLSRSHMFPVWKSYAEYNSFFVNLGVDKRKELYRLLFAGEDDGPEGNTKEYPKSVLTQFRVENSPVECVWIRPAGIKLKKADSANVYIALSDGSIKRLKDVRSQEGVSEQYADESFFYLYTSAYLNSKQKLELVILLKSQVMEGEAEPADKAKAQNESKEKSKEK